MTSAENYRRFEETCLGWLLKYDAPIEYDILKSVSGHSLPSAEEIERMSYMSLLPIFRSERFRLALIDYRIYGLGAEKETRYDRGDAELGVIKNMYFSE